MSVENTVIKTLPESASITVKMRGDSGEDVLLEINPPSINKISDRTKQRYADKDRYYGVFWGDVVNDSVENHEVKLRTGRTNSGNPTLDFCYIKVDYFEERDIEDIITTLLRTLDRAVITETNSQQVLEESRRQKLASDESDEILDESLQSILEEDPDLQRFFENGNKATADVPAEGEASYNPPEVPDTFKIISTYDPSGDHEFHDLEEDGRFSLKVPINRTRQVRFYLNAPNDYFIDDGQGDLWIRPTTDAVQWSNLNKGVLTIGITTPSDYDKGDILTLILNVSRPDDEALSQRVNVQFTEEQETKTKNRSSNPPEPTGSAGLSLPNINRVEEEDWSNHDFDEHDIVRIATAGDNVSDMDIYVNMNAAAIRRFLQNRNLRESGKEFVQERYVVSVALYSVAMYVEFQENYEEDDLMEFASPEELVASSMRGMGQVLLHSIAPKQLLSEY